MWKRVLTAGIIVVGVIAVLLVFFSRKAEPFQYANAGQAVPSSTILYIDNLDFSFFTHNLQNESQLWNALTRYSYFEMLDSAAMRINSIVSSFPALEDLLEKGQLSMSVHQLGKSKLAALFYVETGDKLSVQQVDAAIETAMSGRFNLRERKYETVNLKEITCQDHENESGFSYCICDGLLILGGSSLLVEDAVRTLHSDGGIHHHQGFRKVASTAGKFVQGNLYLNYHQVHRLFPPILTGKGTEMVRQFPAMAEWGEFDIDIRKDVILLNGMTCSSDSLPGWLNVFRGQSPVRLEAAAVVPSYAIDFMTFGISDPELFRKNFLQELKRRNGYAPFAASEKNVRNILGESFFNDMLDLLSDEITTFTLEDQLPGNYNQVVVFEVRSHSEAYERLSRWISVLASNAREEPGSYVSTYRLDDEVSYPVFRLPETYYSGMAGRFFKSYFVVFDNYVVFADSRDAVSKTIYYNVLHKTLENEVFFEEVNNLMSTRANFTYFVRPEKFLRQHEQVFREPVKAFADSISQTLRKVPGLVIQYASEDDMFYSNISLNYSSEIREKARTVWESLLDTVAIMKPCLVTNHYTSEKEILVQDAGNTLYLINGTGRILWKLPMEEAVLSEVYQVDYYKNGKLQYLFNTTTGIHLLDRNGNYVERYPVRLRAGATNGMALFNYDNRNEYRIFVACDDRRVYLYDLEGKVVPGWDFGRTEGRVRMPVQHFRINDRDYIVFSDQIRTYILNRRGHERIKTREPVVASVQNMFYLDMNIAGSGPRFMTTTHEGNVIGIDTEGDVEVVLPQAAAPGHYFIMKDLDRDGTPELILTEKNELEVLDIKGKRLFSFKIKGDISTVPDIYQFSSRDLKIGLTDREKNQIYLLNADGSLYEGFPLEGNTRYSIGYFTGSDSRFNLVVGSQNGFLYNYSIE